MPEETCRYMRKQHPHIRKVGVLSSNGTYASGIYTSLLQRWGYTPVLPDPDFQHSVVHQIMYDKYFGIKANPQQLTKKTRSRLRKSLNLLQKQGAELVILACTELSQTLEECSKQGMPTTDSTEAMALALIQSASVSENKVALPRSATQP